MECFAFDPSFAVDIVHAKAQIHIQNDRRLCIRHVKILAKSRHKNHRELQPFALMNAHDPHDVGILVKRIRLTIILLVFLQLFNIPDEMKQPVVGGLLEVRGLHQKHLHVCPALCSTGKRGYIIQIIGFPNDLLQQLTDWKIACHAAVALQPFQEII